MIADREIQPQFKNLHVLAEVTY